MSKFIILLFSFILISSYGLSIYQHELVHIQNNSKIGLDSKIDFAIYNGLPAIGTYKEGNITRDLSNYELAQSYNETIQYNLSPLLIGLVLTLFVGFIYIGNKIEGAKQ